MDEHECGLYQDGDGIALLAELGQRECDFCGDGNHVSEDCGLRMAHAKVERARKRRNEERLEGEEAARKEAKNQSESAKIRTSAEIKTAGSTTAKRTSANVASARSASTKSASTKSAEAMSASKNDGPKMGDRVSVLWPHESSSFEGTVVAVNGKDSIKVLYDDEDLCWAHRRTGSPGWECRWLPSEDAKRDEMTSLGNPVEEAQAVAQAPAQLRAQHMAQLRAQLQSQLQQLR